MGGMRGGYGGSSSSSSSSAFGGGGSSLYSRDRPAMDRPQFRGGDNRRADGGGVNPNLVSVGNARPGESSWPAPPSKLNSPPKAVPSPPSREPERAKENPWMSTTGAGASSGANGATDPMSLAASHTAADSM